MKPCVLRPKAREDRRSEVRYYRNEAGARVAGHLVDALAQALEQMGRNPAMGSPTLGQELRVTGLRTWRVRGFPLAFWYFEREAHVDVVRVVGNASMRWQSKWPKISHADPLSLAFQAPATLMT